MTAGRAWQRARCSVAALVLGLAACSAERPAPVEDRARAGVDEAGCRRPRPSRRPRAPAVAAADTYVVKRGDTLYSIALDNGVDWRELAGWNQITDPSRLQRRPGAAGPPAARPGRRHGEPGRAGAPDRRPTAWAPRAPARRCPRRPPPRRAGSRPSRRACGSPTRTRISRRSSVRDAARAAIAPEARGAATGRRGQARAPAGREARGAPARGEARARRRATSASTGRGRRPGRWSATSTARRNKGVDIARPGRRSGLCLRAPGKSSTAAKEFLRTASS